MMSIVYQSELANDIAESDGALPAKRDATNSIFTAPPVHLDVLDPWLKTSQRKLRLWKNKVAQWFNGFAVEHVINSSTPTYLPLSISDSVMR